MTESVHIVWIILGTVAVTLFAVITGFVVATLLDLRKTARTLDDTVQRLSPDLEATLANVRKVSESAVEATDKVTQVSGDLGETLVQLRGAVGPMQQALGKGLPVIAGLSGILAAWKALKTFRGGSDDGPDSKKRKRGRQ